MLYARTMDRSQLLAAAENARHRTMNAQEWEEQRRSFAYGNTAIENPRVTRAMVDEAAERLASRVKTA